MVFEFKIMVRFFTKETHRDHSETQAVIVSISQSLAKYFKDVDWAPTDMAVGLILLKQEQKIVRDVTELRNAGLNDDHDWSNWYQHESLNRNQVHRRKSQIEPDVDPQPSVIKGNHVDHSIKMQTFSFNVLEGEDSSDQSGSPKEHHPSQRLSLSHLPSVATLQEYANKVTQNIVGSHEESSLMVNTDLHKGKESQSNQLYNSPVHESKQSQSSLATLLDPPNSAPETVEMRPLTLNKKPRPTSAFYSSSVDRVKSLNKSKSYAVGSEDVIANANVVENFQLEYYEKQRQKLDWTFNSYAFSVPNQSKIEMKRPDILDVIHFCHYANMAYVQLDNEVQSKMDVLIHFSPLNDLFQSPYLVSLDHDWNSIVIAIRGTYSAADVIVDLKLDPEILDEDLPDPESYQVHSGFLRTAKNIVADILSNHILENIMGNRDSRVSKYSIVVCGHSLGGGVAAFVAYMLRKHGYMQTRCYAYAMPGGCTSEKASGLFNDFCISIVGGDDVVSRTTVRSLEILKADVGRLLNHSNQAKYQIFGSILSNQLKTKPVDPEVRIRKYSVSNTEYDRIRATTLSIPKRWKVNETSHAYLEPVFESETSPMFIPGRILYIEKLKDITQKYKSNPDIIPTDPEPIKRKRGQKSLQAFTDVVKERIVYVTHISVDSKYIYLPRWATKEEFQEVVVSRTMISDHTAIFGILKEYEDIHPDLPLKVYS
ncbi:hypothetical protein BC833DRAFT_109717 [Globomyces pollinis-pini]|nr:hypothetical protein BC833DRAFT_109717 [Globomyces pollinis-pini]